MHTHTPYTHTEPKWFITCVTSSIRTCSTRFWLSLNHGQKEGGGVIGWSGRKIITFYMNETLWLRWLTEKWWENHWHGTFGGIPQRKGAFLEYCSTGRKLFVYLYWVIRQLKFVLLGGKREGGDQGKKTLDKEIQWVAKARLVVCTMNVWVHGK
jgi:hypothetical protein